MWTMQSRSQQIEDICGVSSQFPFSISQWACCGTQIHLKCLSKFTQMCWVLWICPSFFVRRGMDNLESFRQQVSVPRRWTTPRFWEWWATAKEQGESLCRKSCWFEFKANKKTVMNEEFPLQESTGRLHFAIEWQASEAASLSSKLEVFHQDQTCPHIDTCSDAGNISNHLQLNRQ